MKDQQAAQANSTGSASSRLPMTIWALGLGSLLMDSSSELVHSLSPALLVNVLGASVVSVGLIEGVAEGIASVTKVFAGAISDYFRRRKTLIVLGYALAAVTRPLFPLAQSASVIFAARFLDRMSKASRDAPRDALVADVTAQGQRGAAYGLRAALDSLGSVLGPSFAVLAADRVRPRILLLVGLSFLVAADVVIGLWPSITALLAGAILWGCHLALTQGVFAKVIAEFTPVDLRSTGFGIFDLARGIAFLLANTIVGYLWKAISPTAAFVNAAVFATIAGITLAAATRRLKYAGPHLSPN